MTSLVQFVPQVSVSQLNGFAERGEVITEDGEVLMVDEASNDDLVAWSLVATYLRDLARLISTSSRIASTPSAARSRPHMARHAKQSAGPASAASRRNASAASSKSAPQMV